MHYSTVFDAAHQPAQWTLLLAGFLVIVFGAAIAWRPKAFEVLGLNNVSQRPVYRWSFLVLGVLWTALAIVKIPSDARVARQKAVLAGCVITEGRVENFHPMPREGHDMESFTVNGVEFHYSDYVIDGAFNNAASHGGPIRAGLPVRICHREGRILKLEVAR